MEKKFTKKYQIWVYSDSSSFIPYEYDTLKECLLHERYGQAFYLTEKVDYEVKNLV